MSMARQTLGVIDRLTYSFMKERQLSLEIRTAHIVICIMSYFYGKFAINEVHVAICGMAQMNA